MKNFLSALLLFCSLSAFTQQVKGSLEKAWTQFTGDAQLRHAISSLHVINAKTGAVVFSRNAEIGLSPASTQKSITSATTLELVGGDFRFETNVGYSGKINGGRLEGDLLIFSSGDPTFGSWRWESTGMNNICKTIASALKKSGVNEIIGDVVVVEKNGETQQIPDGWIWQDIGNYYGAGVGSFIWHENQYDLFLRSGKNIGGAVTVAGTSPELFTMNFSPELTSAAAGTGDNAYIYLPIGNNTAIIRGTIPVNEQRFRISGAIYDPATEFATGLKKYLAKEKFVIDTSYKTTARVATTDIPFTTLITLQSPVMDSIIYWFNRKSINLYGEALTKSLAIKEKGTSRLDSGIAVIRSFWKEKGIDEGALNMRDGSGLSPLNRITTNAQVQVLKYARSRPWFPAYYHSLPEYNGMKAKSGTISDVKGFCGYHKSKDGTEYIFSFLVNNYSGRASTLVGKMYKVLDELK